MFPLDDKKGWSQLNEEANWEWPFSYTHILCSIWRGQESFQKQRTSWNLFLTSNAVKPATVLFLQRRQKKIRIPIPGFMLYITSVYKTCLLNLFLTDPYNSITSFQNPFKYTLQAKQETGGLLRTPTHGSRKGTYVCRTCQYLLNNFLTATLHMDGTRTLICFSCDEYPCTTSL
jgi:hypothetical protein